jgi:hypothetical protein
MEIADGRDKKQARKPNNGETENNSPSLKFGMLPLLSFIRQLGIRDLPLLVLPW